MDQNQILRSMGPPPFNFKKGSAAVEWKNWLRGFEIFADASNISNGSKKNWLLHYGGPKVQSVYFNTPSISDKKKQKKSARAEYRRTVDKLTDHFAPKQNQTYERHIFRNMSQRKNERIDEFVMRLRVQAERCEFGRRTEENIMDQVTTSCDSIKLRRKILERNHKSLESVLKLCRIHESVSVQEKMFTNDSKGKEDVRMENDTKEGTEVCHISNKENFRQKYYGEQSKSTGRYECSRCASKDHKSDDKKCPAKGKKCERCGKPDHFARKCRSRISDDGEVKRDEVRMVDVYDDYDDTF